MGRNRRRKGKKNKLPGPTNRPGSTKPDPKKQDEIGRDETTAGDPPMPPSPVTGDSKNAAFEWWLAFWAAVQAIGTMAGVVVAVWTLIQINATVREMVTGNTTNQQMLALNKRELEESRRAWLVVTGISDHILGDKDAWFDLKVENMGTAPGHILRMFSFTILHEGLLERQEQFEETLKAQNFEIVWKDMDRVVGEFADIPARTPGLAGDFAMAVRNKLNITVIGGFTYKDPYASERELKYCFTVALGAEVPAVAKKWITCPFHNSSP